nr:RNA polymerase subunit sigma-24 [uncultured Caproiciproducens sp.]
MKNYRDSDYSVNKYSKAIVYRFSDKVIEVTLEAYLAENPGKTVQNFEELKILSDEIYFEQDRSENAQTKKNLSIHGIEETDKLSTLPLEDEYIRRQEDQLLEDIIDKYLTEKQARRIRLCIYQGLSSRKIARLEGLHYRTIQDSLVLAKKKLKNI